MKLKIKKTDLIIILSFLSVIIILLIFIFKNITVLKATQPIIADTQVSSEITASQILDIKNCLTAPDNEKQSCMDTFMDSYFKDKTTKQVLADIESARAIDSTIENDCHVIVHSVGRTTYKLKGNIGDAFEACDQTCHSGCYHGVMERLFYGEDELVDSTKHLTYEDLATKIPGICNADKFKNPSNAVIFQCLHGVGHAILYTLNYNLEDSLKSCELLSNNYEISSCWGGVIMENVTAFDKKKRDLKADDPSYPCTKLDSKYKSDCYMMQTSVMYEYGLNDQQVVEECKKAGEYKPSCFISIGRDLSNFVRIGEIDRVVKVCEEYSTGFVRECVQGVVYALVDNTWNGKFAYKYCSQIKNNDDKKYCFQDVNSYLQWSYQKNVSGVQDQCREFANSDVQFCIDNIEQYNN